jgi:hypothetical protein
VPQEISAQLDSLRRDWPEVAHAELRSGKRFEFRNGVIGIGMATLDELASTAENSSGAVLAFLVGHEAWHSVQKARHTPGEIATMRDNRMLECEADFMGGAAAYRYASSKGLVGHGLEDAHDDLVRWLGNGVLAGDPAVYLKPEARAWAASIGWAQAQAPGTIRYEGFKSAPADESGRAAETCRKIAGVSDGSLGGLEITWDHGTPPATGAATQTITMKAENKLNRRVAVDLLIPTWLDYLPPLKPDQQPLTAPRPAPLALDVLDVVVELGPKQKMERSFSMKAFVSGYRSGEYGYYSFASPVAVFGRYSDLVASRYADPEQPHNYCISRIQNAASIADRTLLARIGAIAVAAGDDFEPVRSARVYDNSYGQLVDVIPAVNIGGDDWIQLGQGPASANLTLLRATEDQAVISEYARLKSLLEQVCGATEVAERPLAANAGPDVRSVEVPHFAPRASLRVSIWLRRDPGSPANGTQSGGGNVWAAVTRVSEH